MRMEARAANLLETMKRDGIIVGAEALALYVRGHNLDLRTLSVPEVIKLAHFIPDYIARVTEDHDQSGAAPDGC